MVTSKKRSYSWIIAAAVAAVFAVAVPLLFSGYSLMLVNNSLIYALIVFGIALMLGMGGQLSFAGLAFMGLGSYFVANVTTGRLGFQIGTLPALILTILFCGIVSFVIGLVLLKLKGTYFTFASIALVQVCYSFFMNYRPLFGGPDGISSIPSLNVGGFVFDEYNTWFYLLFVIVILAALFVQRIRRTTFGRSLASVRDNDTAALVLGVNVYMTKVWAFTIAGMLAGLAGGLYVMQGNFVASDLFTYNNASQYIIMAMVGGINSTVGSIVGAILITVLPEVLRSLERYMQLIYGIMVIVMMVFMPMGIAGIVQTIKDKILHAAAGRGKKTVKEG